MNDYYDYYAYMNNMNTGNGKLSSSIKDDYSTDPYTALVRGNLFNNLYTPYKNYKPVEINPKNEKEYAMLLIQTYGFAAYELTLYLDTHPEDSKAISKRAEYMNMYKQALAEYESKYGAITLESEMLNRAPWGWETNNWPWEGDK